MIQKTAIISLPLTPANFTTKTPIVVSENAAIVQITAGSGMGGSLWEEYIVDFDPNMFTGTGLITVKLWNGTTKMINLRNVVTVTPNKMIKVCVVNDNKNFNHNYSEMFFMCNDPVELVESYNVRANDNAYIIKPFKTIQEIH